MRERCPRWLAGSAAFLVLVCGAAAWSVDGVLEIQQDCALVTGCFAGDTPGFPVRITASGSYRLTGNLTVPGAADAVEVEAHDVSIDLNGFSINGGASSGHGIEVVGARRNLEVKNGTIRGFGGDGVHAADSPGHRVISVRVLSNAGDGIDLDPSGAQSRGHSVEGCTVTGNGGAGIHAGAASRVASNTVRGNTGNGIEVGENSAVIDNTVSDNTGVGLACGAQTGFHGNVLADNTAGAETCPADADLGSNLCNGAACAP